MTDTTTIEVRTDQAEQLRELQHKNGNYKTAIDRVLESWENESEAIDPNEIERALVNQELDHAHFADQVAEQVVRELEAQR